VLLVVVFSVRLCGVVHRSPWAYLITHECSVHLRVVVLGVVCPVMQVWFIAPGICLWGLRHRCVLMCVLMGVGLQPHTLFDQHTSCYMWGRGSPGVVII
jgi:hypothetical protein